MTDLDKDIQAGHYALDKLRAATHNFNMSCLMQELNLKLNYNEIYRF